MLVLSEEVEKPTQLEPEVPPTIEAGIELASTENLALREELSTPTAKLTLRNSNLEPGDRVSLFHEFDGLKSSLIDTDGNINLEAVIVELTNMIVGSQEQESPVEIARHELATKWKETLSETSNVDLLNSLDEEELRVFVNSF